MTTHTITTQANPGTCRQCGHPVDDHTLVLIREDPVPMGLVLCPVPCCACGSTWRAGTGVSTPEQIAQTRRLVRDTLRGDGYDVPSWLL